MQPLRIAFLSDEFPSESPDAGGLASYLERITQALVGLGHEVEVLTRTFGEPRVLDWRGVRVESVRPLDLGRHGWARHWARWKWRPLPAALRGPLRTALALARAFEARHAQRDFHLVQSSNCSLSGLFVPRRPGLRHLLRLSSERGLWLRADGVRPGPAQRGVARLERRQARRADVVYAPSHYLAEHLGRQWGLPVAVLRPPLPEADKPASEPPARLPERFLLHFGALRRRKGSELLARALPLAWEREPGLRLVLAGREHPAGWLEAKRREWGGRVQVLGALERKELRSVIARARACVLPSLADNLPNTALESLVLGVGVVAWRDASLDELVEDGRSGTLLPTGDLEALADAMVRAWRGEAPWQGAGFRRPILMEQMAPAAAAGALVRLALGGPL